MNSTIHTLDLLGNTLNKKVNPSRVRVMSESSCPSHVRVLTRRRDGEVPVSP